MEFFLQTRELNGERSEGIRKHDWAYVSSVSTDRLKYGETFKKGGSWGGQEANP